MHLGDGAMTIECAYLTMGGAAAGLAAAAASIHRDPLDARKLATAGALCAAVYAAQMVNVPVLPFSSAHLVGGVLLAWCLGPALGALTMAVVLAVQAIFLGDGGVMAWGANVINMSLMPAGLVWLARRETSANPFNSRPLLSVVILSFASVLLAAGLIVGEVALFRDSAELAALAPFAGRMLALHAWIGVGETLVTCGTLLALGTLTQPGNLRLDRWRLAGVAAASLLLILVGLPFASTLPDGYEAAVQASGLEAKLLAGGSLFGWQAGLQASLESLASESSVALATMCVAVLVVCGLASLSRVRLAPAWVARRRPPTL